MKLFALAFIIIDPILINYRSFNFDHHLFIFYIKTINFSHIVRAALENKAEICTKTMDLFVSILGSEAGNLALKVLATNGIYLGGGIPRRILPLLKTETFRQAFTDKGRFANMLCKVPVYVITHQQAGMFGAACYGLLHQG